MEKYSLTEGPDPDPDDGKGPEPPVKDPFESIFED